MAAFMLASDERRSLSESTPPIDRHALRTHLDTFTKSLRASGVAVETMLREGHPVSQILDVAASLPADLIVMGTHGRGGLDRLALGSVTEKVLRKASCPLLTVTLSPDPGEEVDRTNVFRRILCAVDFSETSSAALRYAISIATEAHAKLSFLHVIEGPPDPERDMAADDVPYYLKNMEQEAQARLRTLVPAETRQSAEIKELVRFGKSYLKILRVAMLFGSTANHVVRQAGCTVLTLRTA